MGLKEKLLAREATLGVIGLGYVGLPLAVEKAKAGFKVYGFDVQKEKVDMVNAGKNYIGDVVNEDLEALVKAGQLVATSNFADAAKCDCVCICVPTPLDAHQQPDISYVRSSTESIMPYVHKDMLVVLESTTYPGTTEELCKPILEKSGLKCGEDFYLAFSPERVDPGNLIYKTKNTPKVVGGCTPKCTEIAAAMYETVLEAPVYKVSSPAIAEMEKILENTYRNVNIGLINELAILCDRMGINIWEVIDAAKSKPYGFQAFYPGPGLGGHCIPLDPYYLSWKAREYGFHTSMIESSMMVNDRMPEYCLQAEYCRLPREPGDQRHQGASKARRRDRVLRPVGAVLPLEGHEHDRHPGAHGRSAARGRPRHGHDRAHERGLCLRAEKRKICFRHQERDEGRH